MIKSDINNIHPNLISLLNCLGYSDDVMVVTTDPSFYEIQKHTLYHDLLCLIISQRISFTVSRNIRKKLRDACKDNEGIYDPSTIKSLDLKSFGLSNTKILKCIDEVTNLAIQEKLNMSTIKNIPGIGDWTYNGLIVMGHRSPDKSYDISHCISHNISYDIFLYQDAWIRKRLSELLDTKLTPRSANDLIDNMCGYMFSHNHVIVDKSKVSRFLWRIKDTGIKKICNESFLSGSINLTRDDFL